MTYATAQDMIDRFGQDELDRIGADGARIELGLNDAAAEIDAALVTIYRLPLEPGPWPSLRSIQCDLARERLYERQVTETVADRAAIARAALMRLNSGKDALLDAGGTVAPYGSSPTGEGSPAKFKGPATVMTSDNLEGF